MNIISSRFFIGALLSTNLQFFIGSAWANGAPYKALPMGGIQFNHNQDISIENEVLHITPASVRVSYTFRSMSKKPIFIDIAFPTAEGDTEGPYPISSLDFEVVADGKTVITKRELLSLPGRQSVDAILKRAGESAPDDIETLLEMRLSERVQQEFTEAGIPFGCDNDNYCRLTGNAQELFTWRQIFNPGLTHIEVSYTPWIGHEYVITSDGIDEPVYDSLRDTYDMTWRKFFCIDKPVEDALKKRELEKESENFSPIGTTVHYILSTANYWNGPIKNFHLIIEKNNPHDIVSYCPTVGRKTSPTRFEWQVKDFVPTGELIILYLPALKR